MQPRPVARPAFPPAGRAPRPQDSPISRAIDEVEKVIASLTESLEDMEHVLGVLQEAEEQKMGDEKEIEGLRRALQRLQRPVREPRRVSEVTEPVRPMTDERV